MIEKNILDVESVESGSNAHWKMPRVIAVETQEPYTLILTFDTGETVVRKMDMSNRQGVFEPLKDPAYFKRVSVDTEGGTVVWPNGVDIDPEVLYDPALVDWKGWVRDR